MSGSCINRTSRWCSGAVVCLLMALSCRGAMGVPAVLNNDVYLPLPSATTPEWSIDLLKNISRVGDLREFFMKYVEDERICTSPGIYEIITRGQNSSDKSGELWWYRRCGTRRSSPKRVTPFPSSTLKRYRRKSSNRRSTQQSRDIPAKDWKKIDKLIKNKKVKCNPKKAVVPLPNTDANVILKPSCVYIKQCGGCCDSPLLECRPVQNKTRKFTVLSVTKKYDDTNKVQFSSSQAVAKVSVTEHKKCECQCKEREEHCTESQIYDKNACRCTCPRQESCSPGKVWDEKSCQCVCNDVSECTSGRYFNTTTCRCLRY